MRRGGENRRPEESPGRTKAGKKSARVAGVSCTGATGRGGGGRVQPACSCLFTLPLPPSDAAGPSPGFPVPLRRLHSPRHRRSRYPPPLWSDNPSRRGPGGTTIISRGAARLLPPVEGCTPSRTRTGAHAFSLHTEAHACILSRCFAQTKVQYRRDSTRLPGGIRSFEDRGEQLRFYCHRSKKARMRTVGQPEFPAVHPRIEPRSDSPSVVGRAAQCFVSSRWLTVLHGVTGVWR